MRHFAVVKRALAVGMLAATALASCVDYGPRVCDDPRGDCTNPMRQYQRVSDFRRENVAQRPPVGSTVDIRYGIVIAVDEYLESPTGKTGDVWIEERLVDPMFAGCATDPSGAHICGLQLFAPQFVPTGTHLLVGDLVKISGGQYQEFACQTCTQPFPVGRALTEIAKPNAERVGSGAPPVPVDVTLAQLTGAATTDNYMGILVRVTDTVTLQAPNTRGELPIGTGIAITPQLTALVHPTTGAPLAAGMRLVNIVGVASYFYSTKLIPRSPADYTVVP